MREAATGTWKYADPENHDLKQALAARLGVPAANIAIGEGIDGLLGQIVRLVIEPGMPVVTSLGAYPTFNYHVVGHGGRLVTVPYVGDREDLDGLLAAVEKENAPLVYFANPDNPMGSWWDAERIVEFARALPETTLFILDEAYCETAPAGALPAINSLIDMPNVVRTRTFSKAYGLAGSRVGYVITTPGTAAQAFDKIRNHFGMNRIGVAAAVAALADQDYLKLGNGKDRAFARTHRRDRQAQRIVAARFCDQFRCDRLWTGRGLCACDRRYTDERPRHLHPHARRSPAQSLHSRQHRAGSGDGSA